MPKRTNYYDLPLLPHILAEDVIRREYTGEELSTQLRSPNEVAKFEALRKEVTEAEENLFCELCDERCKKAYQNKSEWFMKILRMKDGRAQLQVFLSHWLTAFLQNGKKSITGVGNGQPASVA